MSRHYDSAEELLHGSDAEAADALAKANAGEVDKAAAVLAGAVVHILAAQVHATLAVADEIRGRH